MEEMKCKSCGGNLKNDKNGEYAYCEYCSAKYKLKDNMTVNLKLDDSIKETIDTSKKFSLGIFVFAFVVMISIMIFSFSNFKSSKNINSENSNNSQIIDDSKNSVKVKSFNGSIELFVGTQSKFFVQNLLDTINTSNKKNDRKIVVIYDSKKITDSEEIINIKSTLEDKDYEVVTNYDKDGYIYEVEVR